MSFDSPQYGGRIKAAAIYLNVHQLLPEDRAAQALSDLFGAPRLCPASLTGWVSRRALDLERDLERAHARIGARLAEAKVRHLDETSLWGAGKLHWLHTNLQPDAHLLPRRGKARRGPLGAEERRRRA